MESAGARHAADRRALRGRHVSLGNGAVSDELNRRFAEEMENTESIFPILAHGRDEAPARGLEPGRGHVTLVVSPIAELFPVASITQDRPRLNVVSDSEPIKFILGNYRRLQMKSKCYLIGSV